MRLRYFMKIMAMFLVLVGISIIAFAGTRLRKQEPPIPTGKIPIKVSNYYLSESVRETIREMGKALSYGDIKDRATYEALVRKLEAVNEAIERKDKAKTRRALNAFIKETKRYAVKGRIKDTRVMILNAKNMLENMDNAAEFVNYDATIEFDQKTGNYIFRWRGYRGNPVVAIFEPATKIDVIIKASAELMDTSKHRYMYNYEILNGKDSLQDVSDFWVEYKAPIYNVRAPKGWKGWINSGTRFAPPTCSWGANEPDETVTPTGWLPVPKARIRPSTSLKGFSFESDGLPGIVNCYAKGFTQAMRVPEEMPEELDRIPLNRFPLDLVSGKTIGPVREPEVFDRIEFSNYIASLARESLSLGWIGKKEILEGLLTKLELAGRGSTEEAKRLLHGMIDEIEKMGEEDMSSESRSLLKLNIFYLLDKIR